MIGRYSLDMVFLKETKLFADGMMNRAPYIFPCGLCQCVEDFGNFR
jgi:hypothetical protein